ncbi:MAG: D-glycero-beta-D-manno-heptose 1-phosphate adenylyltransferase [Desulfovibrio sp.]|nr:D-glycero-beta-D-manno-heptose 1-phosphate adenylyltransferase [Desulfovibrio sp.]
MDIALDRRIVVIGDSMLDQYTDTSVTRISPEAPVPVANILRRWNASGGAANVAQNLASLGCSVTLVSARAVDHAGQELQNLLDAESIIAPSLLFFDRPTTCKMRILSGGQQLLRLDEEVVKPFEATLVEKIWIQIEHAINWAEGVILSDYGKGFFLANPQCACLAKRSIELCKKQKKPVCVDPTGSDWSLYAHCSCVTPNTKELARVLGCEADDFEGLVSGAKTLMQKLNIERILLTRGAKGMALLDAQGGCAQISTEAKEVADVSGAGDTVIAVLTACVAEELDWLSAARIANTAAGIVVGKVGTSPVQRLELLSTLASGKNSPSPALNALRSKLMTHDYLLAKVSEWRKHHDRIVFTNGCFDLLHPGHVKLIQEAARLGDRLIVALNSDESVSRLKGAHRPIQSEDARALVMAGMANVDSVIIFTEDTPLRLIQEIKPDVLVKGGDYNVDTVVGADVVLAAGGIVHIANLVEGFSTSGIVSAISS